AAVAVAIVAPGLGARSDPADGPSFVERDGLLTWATSSESRAITAAGGPPFEGTVVVDADRRCVWLVRDDRREAPVLPHGGAFVPVLPHGTAVDWAEREV